MNASMLAFEVEVDFIPLPATFQGIVHGLSEEDALRRAYADRKVPLFFVRQGRSLVPKYWNGTPGPGAPRIRRASVGQWNFTVEHRHQGILRWRFARVRRRSGKQ